MDAGIEAIRAWLRLDRALAGFNQYLRHQFGLTGLQLALLRIVAESGKTPLLTLRQRLVLHPATLGQALEVLRRKGYCSVAADPADRRARIVELSPAGLALVSEAPLAGPVRLRLAKADPAVLEALANAFHQSVSLFGLEAWDEMGDAPSTMDSARQGESS